MAFEFDPQKSAINAVKHGIDFEAAQLLWVDANRVEFSARFKDEIRQGLVARYNSLIWCAIFTVRGEKIRIISVRRAREYEEKLYNNR